MHIPDGYLGPATYGGAWAIMVPVWRHAAGRVRAGVKTSEVPFLAMGTVFSFVAMMFMLPLPGGTTGHITGTPLVAILLGPSAAVVSVSIAIAIQALVLGDGGVTAIGANCFNVAVVGAVATWGLYTGMLATAAAVVPRFRSAGAVSLSARLAAAAVAAYVAVNLGALAAAVELGIQPLVAGTHSGGPAYFPFPLKVSIPAILLPHLTTVGALESAATVLFLAVIHRTEEPTKATAGAGVAALLALLCAWPALAHTVQHDVHEEAIAVRVFYSVDDPAAFAEYDLFGPGDRDPHQTGRTDRNGFVGFAPDRAGTWTLQVRGDSSHGFHGVTMEIKVDHELHMESFSKPLVAAYVKLVTGISIAFGLFGVYALWAARRSAR